MKAQNINIEAFMSVLLSIRKRGCRFINLDMIPDESNPDMNKLIISPNYKVGYEGPQPDNQRPPEPEPEIRNPQVRVDSDDIFNLFNELM